MATYFIIGASSGIGKETAKLLASKGHQVIGTYFQTSPEKIANVDYHPLNILNNPLDLHFLPEKIDGIVYCPGSIHLLPFAKINAQDFLNDYELQVVGAIKIIQKTLATIQNNTPLSIVLFSTVAVQQGFNFHCQVAASKGAIEGFTRSLAAEYAPRIRVNAIAPSITQTPLAEKFLNSEKKISTNAAKHPLKRIGTPQDIANLVYFLISERSSWITGQILHIDGGISSIKT